MECNISELPNCIAQNIFCKLPIKSLLQCMSVCKSWRNIILSDDPYFHKLSREPSSFLLLFERKTFNITSEYVQESLKIKKKSSSDTVEKIKLSCLEFLGKTSYFHCQPHFTSGLNCSLKFVNSCNGLICLQEFVPSSGIRSSEEVLRIVNPMTGDYITLPPLRKKLGWDLYECVLGFSHESNEYKAIRISYRVDKNRDRESTDDNWQAHVYTIAQGWIFL